MYKVHERVVRNGQQFYDELLALQNPVYPLASIFKPLLEIYFIGGNREKMTALLRNTATQNSVLLKDDPDVWTILRKAAIKID